MRIRIEPAGGDDPLGGNDPGALGERLARYAATGIDLLVVDVMNLPDPVAAVEAVAAIGHCPPHRVSSIQWDSPR
jgi:hypothetical protein